MALVSCLSFGGIIFVLFHLFIVDLLGTHKGRSTYLDEWWVCKSLSVSLSFVNYWRECENRHLNIIMNSENTVVKYGS